ncbi:hypothetical protein ACFLXE_08815, partial [Chloroflexota bacterium]
AWYAVTRYMNMTIMSASTAVAVGIFGLLLAITVEDFFSLYLLVGLSAGALLLFRPRRQELVDMVIDTKPPGPPLAKPDSGASHGGQMEWINPSRWSPGTRRDDIEK